MRRLVIPVFAVLLLATACGDSSTSPDQDGGPGSVDTFAVQPTAQVAGGIVLLEGVDLDRGEGRWTARVGGMDATLIEGDDGALRLAVPSFHDGVDFAPPSGAVDVEILDDGIVVARAKGALSVTVPAPAPEASLRMADALGSMCRDVADAALALIGEPGTEEGFALALRAAVDSLVSGHDDFSLRGRLETLDEDEREIVDRLVAASGALEAAERAAERAGALALEIRSAPLARTTELTDSELAARMQLQVMLSDLGTDFLNEANGDLGQVMLGLTGLTLTTGVTAPGQAVLGTVATVLGLVNFAVNNVVLGYLPARVDTFEVIVEDAVVAPGEVPITEVRVVASNAPPAITVLDLVDLVLSALGIAAGSPEAEDVVDVVNQVWNSVLNIVRSQLGAYAASHPDADVAFDVASIPPMTWSATVTDTRFVDPLTFTPNVIGPAENSILAWRAAIDGRGEGRIYARMRSGPDVTSIPQIPGVTYTSGAFGDEVLTSEAQTVIVAPEFRVSASMASAISPGGTNALEVVAGYADGEGGIDGESGIQIQLAATGGTVDESSGMTDEGGSFVTLARLSENSPTITVEVTATDSLGNSATTSVSASAGQLLTNVTRYSWVSARTRIDFEPVGGADFDCDDADDGPSYDGLGLHTDTRASSCSAAHDDGTVSLTASADQTSEVQLRSEDPSLDVLLRATFQGSLETGYAREGGAPPRFMRATASTQTFFRVEFEVASTPLQVDLDCPACLSPGDQLLSGDHGSVVLLGPNREVVFDSRTHATLRRGTRARESMILEPGPYVYWVQLQRNGRNFNDPPWEWEWDLEIKVPEGP